MSSKTIRRYLEANRRMMAEAKDVPIGISVAFLGAAIWGFDPRDPNDPLTLEDLADRLGFSPTTISQHMRYLGHGYREGTPGLGLVGTVRNSDNGRKKIFYLTPRGRGLLSQIEFILDGSS
ncbi:MULTISPECIES: hypothetical protein [unclassified Mesorhizobium]|uniref:hypothetical protein n=1 Tax=unclassified Mesorhizobium TaxID=325217 RepID=UPI003334B7E4